MKNDFLTAELLRILKLLQTCEIPAFPFKGPVLAATAYGNVALRQFSDLDIFVHKRNALRARDLLLVHGYRPYQQMSAAQEAAHLRDHHAYTLKRNDGRANVDLNWTFASSRTFHAFALDTPELWERLEPAYLGDTKVLNLPPEELLLILCAHGAKHGWPRLKWICDVAELLRVHPDMDWDRIMNAACQLRCERILFLGLHLANDLLGASLPKDVLPREDILPVIDRVAAQVRQQLFSEMPDVVKIAERDALYLKLLESWWDRVSYMLCRLNRRITPNEEDRKLLPLPPGLSFLYYYAVLRLRMRASHAKAVKTACGERTAAILSISCVNFTVAGVDFGQRFAIILLFRTDTSLGCASLSPAADEYHS